MWGLIVVAEKDARSRCGIQIGQVPANNEIQLLRIDCLEGR